VFDCNVRAVWEVPHGLRETSVLAVFSASPVSLRLLWSVVSTRQTARHEVSAATRTIRPTAMDFS
jgi:hypothetical protein